jgi:3-oxoacyl-[acyl-carrier protein] reductase
MDCGLNDKVVLVTGGSAGIGRATALLYGREPGCRVAVTYFSNPEGARETVAAIEAAGGQALAVRLDLGDIASVEKAVADVGTAWGPIDVLVANAVQWPTGRMPFEDTPLDAWDEFFRTNLLGTVRLCQLAAGPMKTRGWGRIVLLSSDLAWDSMKGSARYSTLKAALFGLAANLVAELSPFGILTNVVLPSWTLTDRARSNFPVALQTLAAQAFPTGRVTSPEDVASLVVYLGSGINGHVNGERIKVTGACPLPLLTHLWEKALSPSA